MPKLPNGIGCATIMEKSFVALDFYGIKHLFLMQGCLPVFYSHVFLPDGGGRSHDTSFGYKVFQAAFELQAVPFYFFSSSIVHIGPDSDLNCCPPPTTGLLLEVHKMKDFLCSSSDKNEHKLFALTAKSLSKLRDTGPTLLSIIMLLVWFFHKNRGMLAVGGVILSWPTINFQSSCTGKV